MKARPEIDGDQPLYCWKTIGNDENCIYAVRSAVLSMERVKLT